MLPWGDIAAKAKTIRKIRFLIVFAYRLNSKADILAVF